MVLTLNSYYIHCLLIIQCEPHSKTHIAIVIFITYSY